METKNVHELDNRNDFRGIVEDPLTDYLRGQAQELLKLALEHEIEAFREQLDVPLDEQGRSRLVRNGYHAERLIQTGIGPVPVRAPRLRDRADVEVEPIRFQSALLPKYLRRTRSIEALLPWLYLKGVSTGDFASALAAMLGKEAVGLTPSTISRLKQSWEDEHQAWSRRSFARTRYVYFWVDGIYAHARMDQEKQCLLVVMGATDDGKKELIAMSDGYRESTEGWLDLLRDLKRRGLHPPKVAVGDGALGFWQALSQVFPTVKHQRCWVHKIANVLNRLPKSKQPRAKRYLKEIYAAQSRIEAKKELANVCRIYQKSHPKAARCLAEGEENLLAFYDFPQEHWVHLRSTNPIESTFATIRLRTAKTRGCLSRTTTLTMMYKLALEAQKKWKRLRGYRHFSEVADNVTYIDGKHPHRIAA